MSYFYFKKANGLYHMLDVVNYIFSDISHLELIKIPKRYELFKGYDASDEGIKQFGKDFRIWVKELKYKGIKYTEFYSHSSAVKCIFVRHCKGKYEHHKQITKIENQYFQACNNGGLIYCQKGIYDCVGYDFTSFYPSLLADSNFIIPTKEGKEKFLIKLRHPNKLKYGFYRVNISCKDENFKKIFAFSSKHMYTHISLKFALEQKKLFNVNIDLIIDNKPNAYLYKSKDLVPCSDIFKTWYDTVINIKKECPKNKLIKNLSSSLWGVLTQYNTMEKTAEELDNGGYNWGVSDKSDWKITKHTIYDSREYYTVINTNKPFKFNIRLMPFLISYARNTVANVVLKDIDNVVRIYTDNITFKTDIKLNISNLLQEDKTTGHIEWFNASNGQHICNKCNERFNYTNFKVHTC
jgi:hypothetical protein